MVIVRMEAVCLPRAPRRATDTVCLFPRAASGKNSMIPGIDPKVDVAFKKVFGSEPWRTLTISLIDAVLSPWPWRPLVDLELLTPFTPQMTLDDKLSILDIKARDDQGRIFNVEMQMIARATLPQRLLYYWSKLYAGQLVRGEAHDRLCPTISICFVNGRLFSDRWRYHRRFQLLDIEGPLVLTDQLEIHVLELPNFERRLADLRCDSDVSGRRAGAAWGTA